MRDESSLNLVAQSPAKAYRFGMKVIIHLSEEEELKALPLLLYTVQEHPQVPLL